MTNIYHSVICVSIHVVSSPCAASAKDNVHVYLHFYWSTACVFLTSRRTPVQSSSPVKSRDEASTTDGDRAVLSKGAALFCELHHWQLGSSYQSMWLELYWHACWRRHHQGDGDHSVWRWHTACTASELECRQHLSHSEISEIQVPA